MNYDCIENNKDYISQKYAKYRDQSAYDTWKYELENPKKQETNRNKPRQYSTLYCGDKSSQYNYQYPINSCKLRSPEFS